MRFIQCTLFTILTLLCFSLVTLPVTAHDSRRRISARPDELSEIGDLEAEVRFGKDLAARILGTYPLVEAPPLQRYVNLVGKSVALFASRPELTFYFGVLASDEINAFAAPGGYVFITRGALAHMQDEAQLAAVLGHEIAHIVKKHVVKELNIRGVDGSAAAGIAGLIGGASGGYRGAFEQALDEATQILFKRGYAQADELEADRLGLILATLAGYDPKAFLTFLERAERFEPTQGSASGDHLQHAQRIDVLQALLTTQGMSTPAGFRMKRRFHANLSR